MEEQDQLKHHPDLLVAPVLAKDVGRIVLPIKESKADILAWKQWLHAHGEMTTCCCGCAAWNGAWMNCQ